ncbi:DUF5305 domain-containing protein [Chengkuizengella sediminis]|nr:DUF5305 domain-containing protein [Chengkuizengella sediminis]
MTVYSISKPTSITNESLDNRITQSTNFEYKAEIIPNILYPNGGIIDPGNIMIRSITNTIPIYIKSTVSSDHPVEVEHTSEVTLLVQAKDLWEKEFPLNSIHQSKATENETIILNDEYKIELESIITFIENVEEETGISVGSYQLKIIPNINGMIHYKENEIPLANGAFLSFEYSSNRIKFVENNGISEEKSLINKTVIPQYFHLFKLNIPLTWLRVFFSILSLTIVFYFLYQINKNVKRKKQYISEATKIDKKYLKRLINVKEAVNTTDKSIVKIESIKALLQIVDEKDLPIFRYHDGIKNNTTYFLIDDQYFYSYDANNYVGYKTDIETHYSTKGKELSYVPKT